MKHLFIFLFLFISCNSETDALPLEVVITEPIYVFNIDDQTIGIKHGFGKGDVVGSISTTKATIKLNGNAQIFKHSMEIQVVNRDRTIDREFTLTYNPN